MDNIKNDAYYLGKIIEYINFSIKHLNEVTLKEFEDDEVLTNAIMFSFIQISENSSKLSDKYRFEHPEVAWNQIKGIRNKIVHNYEVVQASIVYDTVINDFPVLLKQLGNCM